MKDEDKSKEQLITELEQLRQKVARLDKEITECKLPQRTTEEREERPESKLNTPLSTDREIDEEEISQFIDFPAIQELMDYFYKVTKIGIAILDLKGNILVATGWQDICTKFHRVHPEALRNCIESDLFLSRNVEQGTYILYKCKNNMWDMATPIIAGNRHIANLYLGQFFFEDEVPDYGIFIDQAKMYGFDEREYLAALEQVPRWSRETVQHVMEFYTRFADLVSKLSYSNIKLVRLLSKQKRAEEALQESSQKLKLFAYSVAHDLKSPAIGVYGLTRRLSKHAKDALDEKGRIYCDQILKLSEHIAALVDKVNVYIATKEARLSIETINIAEILDMLKDEFSAQLSVRQIDWLKPETRVEIKADRLCMLRVFRNFVDNSLKYGGERLSKIRTGYEESEDYHIFSFSDDGKGLKEADSEKIFAAFQRDETSRGVEGAGLGLTIVKEIAEQHGGTVWVEPRSRKGVTFYLSVSKSL